MYVSGFAAEVRPHFDLMNSLADLNNLAAVRFEEGKLDECIVSATVLFALWCWLGPCAQHAPASVLACRKCVRRLWMRAETCERIVRWSGVVI